MIAATGGNPLALTGLAGRVDGLSARRVIGPAGPSPDR